MSVSDMTEVLSCGELFQKHTLWSQDSPIHQRQCPDLSSHVLRAVLSPSLPLCQARSWVSIFPLLHLKLGPCLIFHPKPASRETDMWAHTLFRGRGTWGVRVLPTGEKGAKAVEKGWLDIWGAWGQGNIRDLRMH